ncbi:MAG: hypothetical protein N4A46_13575, partial [Schleiferiaceae bacterium]|nr:hypothetical protein [Schleiferiaceae bacterium]
GVQVNNGELHIDPVILDSHELLDKTEKLNFINVKGERVSRMIHPDEMAFTYCGTLFTYAKSNKSSVNVAMESGEVLEMEGMVINVGISKEIFSRSGAVREVHVEYPIR